MTVKKRTSDLNSLERFNMYYKPKEEKLSAGQKVKRFIWNSKTKEFCGRTGGSWFPTVLPSKVNSLPARAHRKRRRPQLSQ
ncbi:hypothetical protein MSG28_001938 [Choristoneura fumiferana]|uniref:Uncharacterized protein n=1 Tax=Choristoneura fumiferana TaxID=7141 RepID=A0ACC0JTM0_CHOFU|nr:hypothetical protein MSG28_001938 [Choristoneura fumiferana]